MVALNIVAWQDNLSAYNFSVAEFWWFLQPLDKWHPKQDTFFNYKQIHKD